MKDCVFQYALSNGMIMEDTGLISKEEAQKLWDSYVDKFKSDLELEREPEMAIWIDMDDKFKFGTTLSHWCGQDFIIHNDRMYQQVQPA